MSYHPMPPLGQATMAASLPVVLASNQSAVSVTLTAWSGLTDAQLRASPVPVSLAAGATAIGKAEDDASANADVGAPAMAVRKATPANTSGTDGDYEFLQMSAGRLWCSATIDAALPTGANVIGAVTQSGTWNIGTVTSLTQMNGQAIAMGSGVRTAGTQRVTIATDDVVPASQSGTWNIGTVTTVTTCSTVTNLAQMAGQAIAMGSGVRTAGTQRVTIATDDSVPVTGQFWAADTTVTGTISALDAVVAAPADNGQTVAGASTAGSLVATAVPDGMNSVRITLGGPGNSATYYFEISYNSTNGTDGAWMSTSGRQAGIQNTTITYSGTINREYELALGSAHWFRVRAVGGVITNTTVTMLFSQSIKSVHLNQALPPGTNIIGALVANQSVNVAQINGVTPLMGAGNTGTGSHRVTISTDQAPVAVRGYNPAVTYRGCVATFRTPGRAGTTGQKIFAIHNATGSTKIVRVHKIVVDKYETVVKAVTVAPPIVRAHRVTVLPTNGTAGSKVAKDTALTSNASITTFGDASADGTSSASALTATIPAGSCFAQEMASRLITAAGYEAADKIVLLDVPETDGQVLRALEGIVVNLDYTVATMNPTTDMWVVYCEWTEE